MHEGTLQWLRKPYPQITQSKFGTFGSGSRSPEYNWRAFTPFRAREFNDFANSAIYTVSPTGTCMISASAGRTFPQSREEFIAAINRFDPCACQQYVSANG
jgi:hypothetical protein